MSGIHDFIHVHEGVDIEVMFVVCSCVGKSGTEKANVFSFNLNRVKA